MLRRSNTKVRSRAGKTWIGREGERYEEKKTYIKERKEK